MTRAIDQYNADLKSAQKGEAKADQDLAAANQAISRCDQSRIPKACQSEFATYKPVIDNKMASSALDDTKIQVIADDQQALMTGDFDTHDGAVDRYNSANRQHNDLAVSFNKTLNPAWKDARDKCNDAA